MKSFITIALLLTFLTSKSQLLKSDGSVDDSGTVFKTVVMLRAPLYNPYPTVRDPNRVAPDTAFEAIKLSEIDFKIVNGALALNNPPQTQKIPVPKADLRQPQKAIRGQKVFTFRNVPASTDDFFLIRNGTIRPPREYSVLGNDITYPNARGNDDFELVILVRER